MSDADMRRFFARHLRANQWAIRVLVAALIVLKAVGPIATPWLIVLAPVWAVPAMLIMVWVIALTFLAVVFALAFALRPWLR